MKKPKADARDELRPECKRSDFGKIVRGKYAKRLNEPSSIVKYDSADLECGGNDAALDEM